MNIESILSIVLPPVTALLGWVFGKRKRKNDFLLDLQASIDLLSSKNKELVERVIQLSNDNIELKQQVCELRTENINLRREIESLNSMLENVKVITKKS